MKEYDIFGIIIVVLIIAIIVVSYIAVFEPWMVSNDIKSRIEIVEPYDDYTSMFCSHDSHGWWNLIYGVIDIESGNTTYGSLRYNRGTGELKGNFNGVELN